MLSELETGLSVYISDFRVFDEDTGRMRLVKGTGEILEECVSRDRQQAINKQVAYLFWNWRIWPSRLPKNLMSKKSIIKPSKENNVNIEWILFLFLEFWMKILLQRWEEKRDYKILHIINSYMFRQQWLTAKASKEVYQNNWSENPHLMLKTNA